MKITLKNKTKFLLIMITTISVLGISSQTAFATPTEYIVNGDFETGSFLGWTVVNIGSGSWEINDGTGDPPGPLDPIVPISGNYDAITIQESPNLVILSEGFMVPLNVDSAQLDWKDRIFSYRALTDDLQEASVQIRDSTGILVLSEIWSTNPGDSDIQPGPNVRSFDITSLLQGLEGQNIMLSIEKVDTLNFFNYIIDDISLVIDTITEVEIDIKPNSDPNCFNNNGNGVIPVAIFGTTTLDVNDIDADTVELEGMEVKAVGKSNKLLAHIEDSNGDGIDDLIVQIEDEDGVFEIGSTSATLTGSLLNGTQIQGTDDICITQ